MDTTTLFIAGVCPVFRSEFQSHVALHADLRLAGNCAYRAMRPPRVAELQPDILLCHMGRLDALAVKKLAKLRGAAIRVVISTLHPVAEPVVAEVLEDNVLHGLLTHAAPIETYLKAVRAVAAGEVWISRKLLQAMVYTARRRRVPGPTRPNSRTPEGLTAREWEIRGLIIRGMSNKEIGRRLEISDMTVKTHIRNLMQKLCIHRRVQLLLRLRGQDRRAIEPGDRVELTGLRL